MSLEPTAPRPGLHGGRRKARNRWAIPGPAIRPALHGEASSGRVFSFLPPGTAILGTRSTDVSSKRKSNQKHEPSDTGARERFGGGNLEQTEKTPRYPGIVPKQLRELSSGAEEPTPFRLDQAYRRNSASGKDEGHLLQTLLRSPGPGWKAARQRGEAAEY